MLVQFAIRPNIRNHGVLSRDTVIKQVADVVGPSHTVDLKSYDLLILVEIYKVRSCDSMCSCRSCQPCDIPCSDTLFRGISFVQRMTIEFRKKEKPD